MFESDVFLNSTGNRLLASLPVEEYEQLQCNLEPIHLSFGEVLYESGESMEYVFFPTTAYISLLYTTIDGETTEMASVGNEGMVGVVLFMGSDTAPNRAVVQVSGEAFRMKPKDMQQEFKRGDAFQVLLLRYTQALITQISQTAVCNRLHTLQQRLCRWLLTVHDHARSNDLQMTHEFISNTLGVSREVVSRAAHCLQDMGAINCERGHIEILDRRKLEANACECYCVVKDEYKRLLG